MTGASFGVDAGASPWVHRHMWKENGKTEQQKGACLMYSLMNPYRDVINAQSSPDEGTEVPDGDTQWVRVEHLDADHGPSESPPKPNLGAMEHQSCLQHLGEGVFVDSPEVGV